MYTTLTIEIYKPTMCRMNICKPSVSKGRSCNALVQRCSRACIWYLSVATLAPRSKSTICTQVPPKMSHMEPQKWTQTQEISTKLVLLSNLVTCKRRCLMKKTLHESSAENQGFWNMTTMVLTRRIGLL